MIFVTKCPCDECVPLIKGAGIKQIYAGDVDVGKKKADISYMKFGELEGVHKFTVSAFPKAHFPFGNLLTIVGFRSVSALWSLSLLLCVRLLRCTFSAEDSRPAPALHLGRVVHCL